jgi:FixJ family two-component response regulator
MHNAATEVAIIDDDFTQRNGLARLLQSVGLAASAYESAEAFLDDPPANPGCILTDMRMPGMSGLQLQHELASRDVRVPLIVLTGHADVPAAVRSMKAGAFDFIEKPCSPQLLLETVQDALRQAEQVRRQAEEGRAVRERFASLTPRERQVMGLVVDGRSNKVIAARLKLSEKTVEFHRAKVMTKMGAESVADLVRLSLVCPAPAADEGIPSEAARGDLGKSPA